LFDRWVSSLSGSYLTPLDAENASIPLFPEYQLVGTMSAKMPEVFAQVSAVARVTGARGSSAGNATLNNLTEYELDPWAEVDASITTLGWQPLALGGPTLVGLTIRNLLNTQYSEPAFGGFDMPSRGRTFLFEVEQRL
jgi:outer membrane receptor protein involved in Fe transport